MNPLAWSILLMVLGLALVVLEVFVPSGGVMGFLAVTSVIAAIVMAFYHSGVEVGLVFVGTAAVAVPTALALAFRYWPSTPMGRRLLLNVPTSEEVLPDSELKRTLRELVGKVGVAKSMMLPSGAIFVEGITVDALSEGMPIEPGTKVRVIEVRGNYVLVRPAEKHELDLARSDDILSQPIESLGLESFDDPLA
jgi:membrane-bound serine protease (ClpP class)